MKKTGCLDFRVGSLSFAGEKVSCAGERNGASRWWVAWPISFHLGQGVDLSFLFCFTHFDANWRYFDACVFLFCFPWKFPTHPTCWGGYFCTLKNSCLLFSFAVAVGWAVSRFKSLRAWRKQAVGNVWNLRKWQAYQPLVGWFFLWDDISYPKNVGFFFISHEISGFRNLKQPGWLMESKAVFFHGSPVFLFNVFCSKFEM